MQMLRARPGAQVLGAFGTFMSRPEVPFGPPQACRRVKAGLPPPNSREGILWMVLALPQHMCMSPGPAFTVTILVRLRPRARKCLSATVGSLVQAGLGRYLRRYAEGGQHSQVREFVSVEVIDAHSGLFGRFAQTSENACYVRAARMRAHDAPVVDTSSLVFSPQKGATLRNQRTGYSTAEDAILLSVLVQS
ncbi:hypothetical protein C8R44DRAFT_725836 [Mycena epipterygia]|nr:hypothetical protein C8R44DRAFT_725836 [Mycena epipterygia]